VPALLFSPRGRLAPAPFARAVSAVYLAAFLSQLLAAPPVVARAGLAPFALVQALAVWCWYCLHAKRARDAGEDTLAALAFAGLYALAVVLLVLMLALIADPFPGNAASAPAAGLADFIVWLPLLAMLTGDPHPGLFGYVAIAALILVVVTMLVAIAFSIIVGRRPSAAPMPAAP